MDELEQVESRIEKFLEEWSKMSHTSDAIYELNMGSETRQAELRASDLALLLAALQAAGGKQDG